MTADTLPLLTVAESARRLGVSESTVWRMIRRGELTSVRSAGRRLVLAEAVAHRVRSAADVPVPPFSLDHPIFRLAGAGRSGGAEPGARDKHGILDR